MSCRSGSNVKIEPVKIWFAQQFLACLEILADGSATYSAKYWLLDADGTNYYVWYNTGASVDPAVAGRTGIEVAITVTDTKAEIVAATIVEINLVTGLKALVDPRNSAKFVVKVLSYNVAGNATIGTMTGALLSIDLMASGFFHDMGFSDGDLEVTLDQQLVDVNAHQAGAEMIAAIVNGMNVELSVALKEVTEENLAKIIDDTTGGTYTLGLNEYRGYGSGQNSQNVLDRAARLILHPVRLADNVYTSDLCMPLAYPKLDSLLYSGENPQLLNLTFRVFRDEFMPAAIDKVFIGNHTLI